VLDMGVHTRTNKGNMPTPKKSWGQGVH